MPSLIYITRVRPLSAQLARDFEAAGFHVKSFAPGEITADECLLVMTADAVPFGFQAAAVQQSTGGARVSPVETDPPQCRFEPVPMLPTLIEVESVRDQAEWASRISGVDSSAQAIPAAGVKRRTFFWQPVATVLTLLGVAVLLLTGQAFLPFFERRRDCGRRIQP